MSIYSLRVCKEKDKPLLIDFLKKYWQEDHIFVKSDQLFRFQHYNSIKDEYNFILGINNQTNEIDGVIGLIPLSQYDPALAKYDETWAGIWKVRSDVKNDEIGILGLFLFEEFNKHNSSGGLGASNIARKFYKLMKYNMCSLSQYYILNDDCADFKIARIDSPLNKINNVIVESANTIKCIKDITKVVEGSIEGVYYPQKSLIYLLNRFQRHPIYKYSFLGIYDSSNILKTILVTRTIEINDSKVIRIVDVFGSLEELGSLKSQILDILKAESAEYIDIMNYGISSNVFKELGFEQLDVNGDLIIPNYFEPFVQKNIVNHCTYKSANDYVMFKADGDQDRPSII